MNPSLEEAIIQSGIQEANELQRNTFSTIKSGVDCLVIAPENSGKTTLIVLSVIQKLEKAFEQSPRALIMVEDKAKVLEMEELLSTIHINEEVETLYNEIVENEFKQASENNKQDAKQLQKELNKLEERKKKLQQTFLSDEISAQDYTELKQVLEQQITGRKVQISENKEQKDGLKEQIKDAILIIPKLLERYRNSTVQEKKNLIGSIFPEKFIFKNSFNCEIICFFSIFYIIIVFYWTFCFSN